MFLFTGFTSAGVLSPDEERHSRGFGYLGTNVDVGVGVGVNVGQPVGTSVGVNRHTGVGVGVGVNTAVNNHGIFKRDTYHGDQSLVYANVETFVPVTSVRVGVPYYHQTGSYVHSPDYYHSNRGGVHVGVGSGVHSPDYYHSNRGGVHVGVGSGVNVGVNLAGVGVGVGVLGK